MFREATADGDWADLAALARRVASRYAPRELSEDISQEVLVRLLVSDPPCDVRSYVFSVARKLTMSHLRAARRREAREQAWAGRLPSHSTESGVFGGESLESRRLPARERLLVGMLLEGRTVREISERAGRPRSCVQREIEELRRQFSDTPLTGTTPRRR